MRAWLIKAADKWQFRDDRSTSAQRAIVDLDQTDTQRAGSSTDGSSAVGVFDTREDPPIKHHTVS